MPQPSSTRLSFDRFYTDVFLPEHRHPLTIALHVLGTALGLVLLPAALWFGMPWLLVTFPLVHAAPGLLAYRLVERNAALGDLRVTRRDHSPLWFIAANHRMSWALLTGAWQRR